MRHYNLYKGVNEIIQLPPQLQVIVNNTTLEYVKEDIPFNELKVTLKYNTTKEIFKNLLNVKDRKS